MADAGSPSRELIELIAQEIGSIEQLEILLHLFRNQDRWWNAAEVYDVVKSSLGSVEERLKRLADRDILETDGSDPVNYRYNSTNQKRARIVAELDAQYRERRVRVVELIYSQISSGASEFARAFRIRKEDN